MPKKRRGAGNSPRYSRYVVWIHVVGGRELQKSPKKVK
jgi:hypothetical protein